MATASNMKSEQVYPVEKVEADITLPGDKSISQRLAIIAGISRGKSRIKGFLNSEDCASTLQAMEALGARVHTNKRSEVFVHGTAGKFIEPAGPLDLGNSGTGLRMLTGLMASREVTLILTGDESLRSRPMKRISEPLRQMGAQVELLGEDGRAPIRIEGRPLKGIEYTLPMPSAQVKSAILLAGLFAEGPVVIHEPAPARDHTERILMGLGVDIKVDGLRIEMQGGGARGPKLRARNWIIPGDFSAAAFWMMLAAARPGSSIMVRRCGMNPRRNAFLDVLKRMGANIQVKLRDDKHYCEPMGDILVTGGTLTGTDVGGAEIPNIIDELPLVAVAGALANGKTVIKDARELRVKESDRISAMAFNLRLMGIDVEETEDGMILEGGQPLKAGSGLRSFGDHRIAMAMAILATYGSEPVTITNVACTETSYPGFWEELKEVGGYE